MVDPRGPTVPPDPDKFVGMDQYRDFAKALDGAIRKLKAAKVRVSDFGRLQSANRTLSRVVRLGVLPTKRLQQVILSNALADAFDYWDITACFGDQLGAVAKDVELSLKGLAGSRSSQRVAQRFQSQLWLGSILKLGGYLPRVPDGPGPKPDFLVEDGLSRYGVEIKRPDSASSSLRAVAKAAAQLRDYGVAGAIMVDLSQAAGFHALAWARRGRLQPRVAKIQRRFANTATRLRAVILDYMTNRLNPGFEHIMALIVVGRTTLWVDGPPSGMTWLAVVWPASFIRRVRDLRYHHSLNMSRRIVSGLNEAGFPFPPFAEGAQLSPNFKGSWRL